jgi:hypothetical protein
MNIRVVGLVPYIVHYLRTESLIAYIVFNNGILFHVLAPTNIFIKWYDIICNSALIMYVNFNVVDYYVFLWSCIACTCFTWNSMYIKHEQLKAIIHIVGVQLPLYRALQLSNF